MEGLQNEARPRQGQTTFFTELFLTSSYLHNRGLSPITLLTPVITIAVLHRTPPHLVRRVLLRVQFDLGVDGPLHVDAELVGQADEVDLDVGEFLFHLGELVGWQGLAFCFGQPLEVLDQFGGLDDERHGEVLRRVELVPVALGGELAQGVFDLVQ